MFNIQHRCASIRQMKNVLPEFVFSGSTEPILTHKIRSTSSRVATNGTNLNLRSTHDFITDHRIQLTTHPL